MSQKHTIARKLRGEYPLGPPFEPGQKPEFGWRQFNIPSCRVCGQLTPSPLAIEAADYIEELEERIAELLRDQTG